jgi:hypothetical protein
MTKTSSPASRWRLVTQHVAFRALMRSLLINLAGPYLLYRLASTGFHAGSLLPLAISAVPPVLALGYSLIKLKAVDFIGLFSGVNIAFSMLALLLAHTEKGALIGRSLPNVLLAAFFLGSLAIGKPLILYMARQLATGNDPGSGGRFDAAAAQPGATKTYRILTWLWAGALLIKAAGSIDLALTFAAKDYLVLSPLWDLLSDTLLVSGSIVYGRARLASASGGAPSPEPSTILADQGAA